MSSIESDSSRSRLVPSLTSLQISATRRTKTSSLEPTFRIFGRSSSYFFGLDIVVTNPNQRIDLQTNPVQNERRDDFPGQVSLGKFLAVNSHANLFELGFPTIGLVVKKVLLFFNLFYFREDVAVD